MAQPNRAQLARQPYPYSSVEEEIGSMNTLGEYTTPNKRRGFVSNYQAAPNPNAQQAYYGQESLNPDETVTGNFYGPDAGRAADLLKKGYEKPKNSLIEKLRMRRPVG